MPEPGPVFLAIATVFLMIVLFAPSCAYMTAPY